MVYTGNRGMAFEATINLVNQLYKSRKIAIINKRPTPVKVLKSKGTKVLSGYFEEKSTVDYDGVYRGRPIYFEAKSVQTVTRFDLSNLHQHQKDTGRVPMDYLACVDQMIESIRERPGMLAE